MTKEDLGGWLEPVPNNMPDNGQEVKVLIECKKKNLVETTTAVYLNEQWVIHGFKGPCFKVIGWDYLDSKNSTNISTETL